MTEKPRLKPRARELRANATPAERALWSMLRAKRFGGLKFSRQVPIGPFIVDFAARSAKLIIEVDGHTHGDRQDYDADRTAWLPQQGYRVIRFTNRDVMTNPEGVAIMIQAALLDLPSPRPSPQGEREQVS